MTSLVLFLPLISMAVCLRAQAIGAWLGVMDHPNSVRKIHKSATPLVGGLAVTLPLLISWMQRHWESPNDAYIGVFTGAVGGSFLLGFFDDRCDLSVRGRIVITTLLIFLSLVISSTFVISNFNFSFLGETVQLHSFSIIFTVIAIVGLMNAMNMADGMNGLLCGLCLIWSLFILRYAPTHIVPTLWVTIISLFITMVFNLKGRLFLGDSGAYALGIVISFLTIYVYNTSAGTLRAGVVLVWFMVPVLDCLRLIITRLIYRRGPGTPDRNHLHHRLQKILPNWGVLFLYWMLVAMPGAVAISAPERTRTIVLAVVGFYLVLLLLSSEGGSQFVRRRRRALERFRPATQRGSAVVSAKPSDIS